MKLENASRYPDSIVRPLVRFALIGVNHGSLAVRLLDLEANGGTLRGFHEWRPREGRTPAAGHRITLALGGPERFPSLLEGVHVRDWREGLVLLSAFEARAIWRRHRYGGAARRHHALPVTEWCDEEWSAAQSEAADQTAFATFRLRAYRELQRHVRRWGWVPVGRLAATPKPERPAPSPPRGIGDEMGFATVK